CESRASFAFADPLHPPPRLSFPTRRSSDLPQQIVSCSAHPRRHWPSLALFLFVIQKRVPPPSQKRQPQSPFVYQPHRNLFYKNRSAEHTSVLHSRVDVVCRLLLDRIHLYIS